MSLQQEIESLKTKVSTTLASQKSALESKGVAVSSTDTFATVAQKISSIPTSSQIDFPQFLIDVPVGSTEYDKATLSPTYEEMKSMIPKIEYSEIPVFIGECKYKQTIGGYMELIDTATSLCFLHMTNDGFLSCYYLIWDIIGLSLIHI